MSTPHDREVVQLGEGVRSILRNGTYLLGAGWLATALRAAYVVILARALGPQNYGLISSAQALYLMFVLGSTAGAETYVAREVAADRASLREALWSALAVEGVCLAVGAVAFLFLTILFHPEVGVQPVFVLLALTLVVRGIATWAMQAFIAGEVSRYQLHLVSLFRTIEVIASVAVLAAGGSVVAIAAIHLLSWALEAAAGLWLVHTRLAAWLAHAFAWRRLLSLARGLIAFSAAVSAGAWVWLAPIALYPYVAIDKGGVGQFALAWNVSLVISTAVLTVMTVAIPVVSRAHARADKKDMYYLSFCIRYGILLGCVSAIAGIGIGPLLVAFAAGENYVAAGKLLAKTLWIIGPIVVGYAIDQTLFLHGRTRLCFLLNLFGLLALLGVFAPALRAFGPEGAVLAVVAVMMGLTILKIALLHPLIGITLLGPTLRAIAAASAGLVAVTLLSSYSTATAAAIGLTVLFVGAFVFGTIHPLERRALLKMGTWKNKGVSDNH